MPARRCKHPALVFGFQLTASQAWTISWALLAFRLPCAYGAAGFGTRSLLVHNRQLEMLNSSQTPGGDGRDSSNSTGELRAFVATRLGGHSWVVDMVPNYELSVGSAASSDIRIDIAKVLPQHATLMWTGEQVLLAPANDQARWKNWRSIPSSFLKRIL